MKSFLGFALFFLFLSCAFAYEDSAVIRALEYNFERLQSFWGLEYSEGQGQCDLSANIYAKAQRGYSSEAHTYNCDICLISDDNLHWEHAEIECERARD